MAFLFTPFQSYRYLFYHTITYFATVFHKKFHFFLNFSGFSEKKCFFLEIFIKLVYINQIKIQTVFNH